jgi:precorrin-2/cobalt-factor-2 C20-methyltransferase
MSRDSSRATSRGRLFGVGVGPGDPELITVKALRILQASPVVASFAAEGRAGHARRIVDGYLKPEQERLLLTYPITTGAAPAGTSYEALLVGFYDDAARTIATILDGGRDVAVVCEGDPLLYGSYMYIHNRLAGRYPTEIVPGIPSVLAGAAVLQTPLVCKEESLSILSGMLPAQELETRLRQADAAVVMKLGRNLTKVRDAVARAGLLDRAQYVERASMLEERVLPLADVDPAGVPYFSIVVIPSATAHAR